MNSFLKVKPLILPNTAIQLDKLKVTIVEKYPELTNRRSFVFQYANVALAVEEKLLQFDWDPHPPQILFYVTYLFLSLKNFMINSSNP